MRASRFFAGNPDLANHVRWRKMDDHSVLVDADTEEEAEIELIGEIDSEMMHFNLLIDGGWRRGWMSEFEKMKARGRVVRPSHRAWGEAADVWEEILDGLRKIEGMKETKGAGLGNMMVDANDGVKIRHTLFEVCTRHPAPHGP